MVNSKTLLAFANVTNQSPRGFVVLGKVYTAFDTHLDALGVYKLDTVGDAFVVVAGLDGFKSKEASSWSPHCNKLV